MGDNYERINFGKYLENVRTSHDVSIDELSEGVCDRSLITRIESGERFSTMLLRDRLIERCGATSEEYEKYVKTDEFTSWKSRMAIIADVEAGKYVEAKKAIDDYKNSSKRDTLEKQFCLDMMAMIAKLEGDSETIRLAENTLRETVEIDQNGFVTSPKLSPKEINMTIEYSLGMEKEKRYEQLTRLLQYADENEIDKRNMVLFYPKLVFALVSENVGEHKNNPEWLARALELTDRASALLADTNRLIYILELTQIKKQLWDYILSFPGCMQSLGYAKFLDDKCKNDDELAL